MLGRRTILRELDMVERVDLDPKEDFCFQDPRCDGLQRLCFMGCVLNDCVTS